VVLVEKRRLPASQSPIRLTPDRTEMNADGEDVTIVRVEVLDKEGRAIPTAANTISFKVSGEGAFIGGWQWRSQLPGVGQGPEAQFVQRPGASNRAVQQDSRHDHNRSLHGRLAAAETARHPRNGRDGRK